MPGSLASPSRQTYADGVAILRTGIRRWRPVVLAFATAGMLSACASLTAGVTQPQTHAGTSYANADLTGAVLAFDVPVVLQPADDPSRFGYDVVTGTGERHVEAELTFAEVDVAESLPVPGNNRTYYLYGVADKDKAALREAQGFAGATTPTLSVVPRFCAVGPIDPQKATISVLILAPGNPTPSTLVSNQPLAALLAASGTTLTACQ